MTKQFVLHEDINKETFMDFTGFINKGEEKIDIHLCSPGGQLQYLYSFLHIINSNPERFRIITTGLVGSTAFDLLLYAKCEKIIGKYTRGMAHLSTIDIKVTSSNSTVYHEGDYFRKENKLRYAEELRDFKKMCPNLTPAKLTYFKQGAEIYFTDKEVKEILKLDWNFEE